jgi:hypothetical protein
LETENTPVRHASNQSPNFILATKAKHRATWEGCLTDIRVTQTYGAPQLGLAALTLLATMTLASSRISAAPTAEVAKRCLHYAYIAYPRRPPGAAPASGDREAYFRDCLNKTGEVPEPTPSPKM